MHLRTESRHRLVQDDVRRSFPRKKCSVQNSRTMLPMLCLCFWTQITGEADKHSGWTNIATQPTFTNIPANTIKISVGLKPLPYFQEKGWKEMRENMKRDA